MSSISSSNRGCNACDRLICGIRGDDLCPVCRRRTEEKASTSWHLFCDQFSIGAEAASRPLHEPISLKALSPKAAVCDVAGGAAIPVAPDDKPCQVAGMQSFDGERIQSPTAALEHRPCVRNFRRLEQEATCS